MSFDFSGNPIQKIDGDFEQNRETGVNRLGDNLPLLSLISLSKSYGDANALSEVSFDLPKGKIIGLLGPNGSGKSTLIKLVAGLLTPTSGTIRVMGIPVGEISKSLVAYLPERNSIPLNYTVGEAIDFYRDFFPDFDAGRAESMLRDLRVEKRYLMRTLSKGTREKVQLVLVMARRAKLYLLDEPISGVDPAARDYIISTILRSYTPDSSILISTHLISDIERSLDGFVMLKEGRLLSIGTPSGLMQSRGQTPDEYFREVFRC